MSISMIHDKLTATRVQFVCFLSINFTNRIQLPRKKQKNDNGRRLDFKLHLEKLLYLVKY